MLSPMLSLREAISRPGRGTTRRYVRPLPVPPCGSIGLDILPFRNSVIDLASVYEGLGDPPLTGALREILVVFSNAAAMSVWSTAR